MKRHRFDPFSFVFGAFFLTIGATFLFGSSRAGEVHPARLWPAALAVVGVTLAFSAVGRVLRPAPEGVPAPEGGPAPEDTTQLLPVEPAEGPSTLEDEPGPDVQPAGDWEPSQDDEQEEDGGDQPRP